MKQPPAFQMYADDMLGGTADMTAEEFGVFNRLLLHSWNKNGLKNEEKRLGLLAGQCHGNATALVMEILRWKFELGADGQWRNARQEDVRRKLKLYSAQQSDNAHKSWEHRRSGAHAGARAAQADGNQVINGNGHAPAVVPEDSALKMEPQALKMEPHFAEAVVPDWAEIKKLASLEAVPEAVAKEFYQHYDANNLWANRHGRPVNVRNSLVVWFNRSKVTRNGTSRAGRPAGAPTQAAVSAYAAEKILDAHYATNFSVSFYTFWNDAKRNWHSGGRPIDWKIKFSEQLAARAAGKK